LASAPLNAKFASIGGRYRVPGAVLRLARSAALRDAAVLGTGAVTSQLILFLAAPLFLRLYRPAAFGLYSFAYGAIALLATLGTWRASVSWRRPPTRFCIARKDVSRERFH
jgi:hypothetical protein